MMRKRVVFLALAVMICLALAIPASAVGYSDEQLCTMVRLFYKDKYPNSSPQNVVVDSESGGIATIHLFDVVSNHTSTYDWYYIDRNTGKGTDLMGDTVDLTSYAAQMERNPDFRIENGVLVKYYGSGGSVVIPDNVTAIGEEVFYDCDSMTSIVIPNSVAAIGDRAFFSCDGLTSVTIPSSVKKLGREVFWGSGLTSVTIGGGVTEFGNAAFEMSALKEVTIREGTTKIGAFAFRNCDGLTKITIPKSVTEIGDEAFELRSGAEYIGVIPGLTIYGTEGSYAEAYARQKEIPFQAVNGSNHASVTATPTASTVLVNGKTVRFDAYNIGGANYFKLRDLAYMLNGTQKQFEVEWNAAANAISLISGEAYTPVGGEMTAGSGAAQKPVSTTSKILLNGAAISMDAYNIGGNNYFKLRDVGAALNFGVDWDAAANTVIIDTSKGYTPVI